MPIKRFLDPNSDGGGESSNPIPSQSVGQGSSSGDYVSKSDFDSFRQQVGGFSQKFDGFVNDYRKSNSPKETSDADEIPSNEPTLSSYDNNDAGINKYLRDLTRFHAGNIVSKSSAASEKARSEQASKAKRQSSYGEHVKRMGEAMSRYKDFDQVVNNAPMALPDGSNGQPDILGDVLDSDHSADLQYHLSRNTGDLYKLINAYNQSDKQGTRFLGQLEAKFGRDAEERKQTLRQTRGFATANAGGDSEGGGGGDDEKHIKMARMAFGLDKK